jgi:hypothetical protein
VQLAQVNIALMRGSLDAPVMAEFASVDEAKRRLEHLERNGPTAAAFTFKAAFPPEGAAP